MVDDPNIYHYISTEYQVLSYRLIILRASTKYSFDTDWDITTR